MEQELLENALSICRKARICVSARNYEGISYETVIEHLSDDIKERTEIEIIIKCIEKQIPKKPFAMAEHCKRLSYLQKRRFKRL